MNRLLRCQIKIFRHMTQTDKICGVYSFVHRETGRRYIGSSKDIYSRKARHIYESRSKSSAGKFCIHRAIERFGEAAFDFEVLEICDESIRFDRENHYIKFYNSASEHGFNVLKHSMPRWDWSVSEMTRRKISETHKKLKFFRPGFKGPHTKETREKMSAAAKADKRRPPIFKGHHKPEILAKFSSMMRGNQYAAGYRHTPEAKLKISSASKGNKHGLGHKHSVEVRGRISESMKKYRASIKHHES